MAIETTVSRNDYTGNGSTATFNYNFKIFQDSHLKVIIINTSTDAETTLVLTTDYTVAGAATSSGSITLVDAGQAWIDGNSFLDSGYRIVLRRVVPTVQESEFRNLGPYYPEGHENSFDYAAMIDQQQDDDLARSLKLSEAIDPADFDTAIPSSFVGAASQALVTNASGNGLAIGPTAGEIANAQTYATAAAAAQSAAESAQSAAETAETNAETAETNAAASAAAAIINVNEVSTVESISASGNISHSDEARQYRPVVGSGAARTTATTVFGTNPANFTNGMEITLSGTSDTNTVTIPVTDIQYGFLSPVGSAVLGNNFSVTVIYDSVAERFIEKYRNH